MSEVTLDPYIFFKGECREAMEFYKDVFGGELTVQTYGDVSANAPDIEGASKDWIMHAKLDGAVTIMGSDTAKASPEAKKITLSLGGNDEDRLRDIFDKLGAGGNIASPLKKEFWGDTFGSLTDKYGIEWMVNIAAAKE